MHKGGVVGGTFVVSTKTSCVKNAIKKDLHSIGKTFCVKNAINNFLPDLAKKFSIAKYLIITLGTSLKFQNFAKISDGGSCSCMPSNVEKKRQIFVDERQKSQNFSLVVPIDTIASYCFSI